MIKPFIFIVLLTLIFQGEEAAIREVLGDQQKCWNEGDLEGYMEGYWQSDQLVFIGKSGVQYGWENTLENYKRSYPTRESMGTLELQVLELYPLDEEYWHVIGKWHLERALGDLSGHFTLLFRQIDGRWVIVSDHSS